MTFYSKSINFIVFEIFVKINFENWKFKCYAATSNEFYPVNYSFEIEMITVKYGEYSDLITI